MSTSSQKDYLGHSQVSYSCQSTFPLLMPAMFSVSTIVFVSTNEEATMLSN